MVFMVKEKVKKGDGRKCKKHGIKMAFFSWDYRYVCPLCMKELRDKHKQEFKV